MMTDHPNLTDESHYSSEPPLATTRLSQRVQQLLGIAELRVRCQIRGNQLLILCEAEPCPERDVVIAAVQERLLTVLAKWLLRSHTTPIYRVILYGRRVGQSRPEWSAPFLLHSPTQVTAPSRESPQPPHSEPVAPTSSATVLELAKQGKSLSIARYLSQRFSNLGISVKVRKDDSRRCLLVACESSYAPDPLVLATPLAQSLRELQLKHLRYALVFAQVSGEAKPEWVLRVDLTPPEEILKVWAKWGDIQALSRLLNQNLLPQQIQATAILKDSTLHLACTGLQQTVPDKLTAIAAIAPLLDSLMPQGIHAATIYGFQRADTSTTEVGGDSFGLALEDWPDPAWIHWHDLPVASQPDLLPSTFELAHAGNLDAITFLLTRQLNPNLDHTLETGGIRVQVCQQGDLLHIMTDAPNCPDKQYVSVAVARLLKPLVIQAITGVRIYGRRAGQKQPLWHYGVDFTARDRLVPEAAPEFAASDAYVGDLLTQSSAIVVWTDPYGETGRSTLQQRFAKLLPDLQQRLLYTRLFISDQEELEATSASESKPAALSGKGKLLAWGLLGLLVVVQADWILGRWSQPETFQPEILVEPSPSPAASEPTASELKLPQLSLQKRRVNNGVAFNDSGFTQPGSATPLVAEESPTNLVPSQATDPSVAMLPSGMKTPNLAEPSLMAAGNISLPASPLQPKAAIAPVPGPNAFPTFNSRQLDRQLLAYRDYVAINGTPDVLIVGSSRALRGVDPVALNTTLQTLGHPGLKIFNLSVNGATAQVINLLLQRILPPDKLPRVILWADGSRAFNSGRPDITYNGVVASKGFKAVQLGQLPIASSTLTPLDETSVQTSEQTSLTQLIPSRYQNLNQGLNQYLGNLSMAYNQRDQLRSRLRDTWTALLTGQSATEQQADAKNPQAALEAMVANGQGIDIYGFLPVSIRFNPATYYQKYARVTGDYDTDYRNFTLTGNQTEALKSLAKFTQQRQISLVLVNLPLTREYLDPIRKRHEDEFRQYMTRLAPQLGFYFRDMALQNTLTRPDYFSDPSHLNRYGAFAVSRQLAQDSMIPWMKMKP